MTFCRVVADCIPLVSPSPFLECRRNCGCCKWRFNMVDSMEEHYTILTNDGIPQVLRDNTHIINVHEV